MNATCAPGHVILITHAHYGRMKLGTCLISDFKIGCYADILLSADRSVQSSLTTARKMKTKDRLAMGRMNSSVDLGAKVQNTSWLECHPWYQAVWATFLFMHSWCRRTGIQTNRILLPSLLSKCWLPKASLGSRMLPAQFKRWGDPGRQSRSSFQRLTSLVCLQINNLPWSASRKDAPKVLLSFKMYFVLNTLPPTSGCCLCPEGCTKGLVQPQNCPNTFAPFLRLVGE